MTEKGQCVVYEYINCNNLETYFEKKETLTKDEVFAIIKQIIDGYQFIKDNGLIHGNIRPSNILVIEKDTPIIKLTDFMINSRNIKDLTNDKYLAPEISLCSLNI